MVPGVNPECPVVPVEDPDCPFIPGSYPESYLMSCIEVASVYCIEVTGACPVQYSKTITESVLYSEEVLGVSWPVCKSQESVVYSIACIEVPGECLVVCV